MPTSQYKSAILADNPIRYYRCDEVSGTVATDSSVVGANGTYSASGVTYGRAGALLLSGDTDTAVSLTAAASLSFPVTNLPRGNTPWTMEGWYIASSYSGSAVYLAGYGQTAVSGQVMELGMTTTGLLFVGVNGGLTSNASTALSLNVWHHVVLTWDGTTLRVYLDGAQVVYALPSAQSIPTTGVTGHFGGQSNGSSTWQGGMDECAFYGYALTPAQVANHYSAAVTVGTGTSTTNYTSLGLYKQQVVMVYNASGQFLDVWRDAPLLSGVKFAINNATTPLKVQLPRKFDAFDEAGVGSNIGTIGQGNKLYYYLFGPGLPPQGLLKFAGYVDGYAPQILESGEESVTVSITPFDAVVGDEGLTTGQSFGTPGSTGTYVDPITMFNWFFSNNDPAVGHPYASPLTLDPANPTSSGNTASYAFTNQKLGSIWGTILKMLPANWFWRTNPDLTATLNAPPLTAQHQLVIGQHIVAPQYSKDWNKLRNVVQVLGTGLTTSLTAQLTNGTVYTSLAVQALPVGLISGQSVVINFSGAPSQTVTVSTNVSQGATSIPVSSFTANATYGVGISCTLLIQSIKTGSDLTTFGKRLAQLVDNRIVDQNTAATVATALLTLLDQMILRTKIRVVDYRGDAQTGLGYDIETLKPGDTVTITNPQSNASLTLWDVATWDSSVWDYSPGAALAQVAVIYSVNYHFDYVDLELGYWQPNQDRELLMVMSALQDFTLV